jgi:hypothetical protein
MTKAVQTCVCLTCTATELGAVQSGYVGEPAYTKDKRKASLVGANWQKVSSRKPLVTNND